MHKSGKCLVAVAFAALLLCGGCGEEETLEDRFFQCRDRVEDKEQRSASLKCFTERSRTILRNLLAQKRQSGGLLDYMQRYRKLLDFDEVAQPPEFHETIAYLLVRKGRDEVTIVFQWEEEEWRIDALELPGFWRRLNEKVLAD